jgi:hypothetical protein
MIDLSIIQKAFQAQGFMGILLLGALYVIWRLAARYDALQEKRVEESLENYKIISDLTQAIRDLTNSRRDKG